VVKKNLTLSFFSALAKIFGGIGIISLLARVFSLSDFGNFTYALTLGTIFSLIIDYGFNIKIIKDVSSNTTKTNDITSVAVTSKFFLFILTALLFFTVNVFLENTNEVILTGFFMFLSLVMFSFINTFLSVFKGKKEYKKDLKVVILDNLVTVIIVSLVALWTKNIQYTAISFFLSKIIGLIYAYKVYKQTNTIFRPPLIEIKRDLYKTLPFAVHYWVGSFYLNIDTVIMKPMVSSEDLGLYQAGIRVIIGLGVLLTIINSVYLPLLNEALLKNINEFKKKVISLNTNVLRIAVICTAGLIICSKLVVLVLFGEKFIELQNIFWIIAFIVGIRIIGASFGILLTISNKQALRAIAGAISIILIIICDLILIPSYGYKVAAIVLLFAHLFITSFYMISIYAEYKTLFMPSLKKLFKAKIEL